MKKENIINIEQVFSLHYKNVYKRILEIVLIDLIELQTLRNPLYNNSILTIYFNRQDADTQKRFDELIKRSIHNPPTKFEYFLMYNQVKLTTKYIFGKTKGKTLNDFADKKIQPPTLLDKDYFEILYLLKRITYTNRQYKYLLKLKWGEILYGIN